MMDQNSSRPVVGVLWMLLSGLMFVGVNALVKGLGTALPAAEGAFLRFGLGLILFLPLLSGMLKLRPTALQWRLVVVRGVVHTFGVVAWFYAMARIPLADVTAIGYLNPILITLGAALFLGERIAIRRILAIVVALIGVLVILRPGLREIGAGHLAMLCTATGFAGSYLIGKRLSEGLPPFAVVALMSLAVTIGLAPLALLQWVPPSPVQLLQLFVVAVLATLGHICMTFAFREAPITVTQPVTFLQLVWAVILGVTLFGEPVDPFTIAGAGLILSAVTFISWREARLKRPPVTPPATATKF